LVENAGFGASAAAPIAKKLCNYWFFDRSDDRSASAAARAQSTFSAAPRGPEEDKE